MAKLQGLAIIIGIIGAFLVFAPVLMRRLTLARLGPSGREEVGRRALASQPDRITLLAVGGPPSAAVGTILGALAPQGFEDAGRFLVKEMAPLSVAFMILPAESIIAVVYEHPLAGVWCDLASRFLDETSLTVSTAPLGGGLDQRPGHPVIRLPGAAPSILLDRFRTARPAKEAKPVASSAVPEFFTEAYAESIAWRKGHGISADEVQKVGLEEFQKPAGSYRRPEDRNRGPRPGV
jgi:hypothetical protein